MASTSMAATAVFLPRAAVRSPKCAAAPHLPPLRVSPTAIISKPIFAYDRKIARNVAAMATTNKAPLEATTTTSSSEVETTTELPELVKTLQDTWEKVEDKYAVTSLAVAGAVGLLASSGMISAIDRLPLIPGVLELVGIGYTGWFAYKNLIFKPEREALIQKITDTYNDIISTS